MKPNFEYLTGRLIKYGILSPSSGPEAWEPWNSLETNMADHEIALIIPLIDQVIIARDRVTKEVIKKAIDDLEIVGHVM